MLLSANWVLFLLCSLSLWENYVCDLTISYQCQTFRKQNICDLQNTYLSANVTSKEVVFVIRCPIMTSGKYIVEHADGVREATRVTVCKSAVNRHPLQCYCVDTAIKFLCRADAQTPCASTRPRVCKMLVFGPLCFFLQFT